MRLQTLFDIQSILSICPPMSSPPKQENILNEANESSVRIDFEVKSLPDLR